MLFNSFEYLVFLPCAFALYWGVFNKLRWQNVLLLLLSYLFYGWWDPRFLSLIIFSSAVDWSVALSLGREERKTVRKGLLAISLTVNLGLLAVFKYYNFFMGEFSLLLENIGMQANLSSLKIILPVGISFYTFQTLSYSIDVYRREIVPTKDPVAFFAFVGFFPQLVAGPIERAKNLIPQFTQSRRFDQNKARDGLRQMLWGLFKKVVVADNAAWLVDQVYSNPEQFPGTMYLLASVFFAFQIYGDFSGYSDIAIGTARLFGFNLMRNFAYPYFSRDIAEFWRRWHISLSTWFRDYLYIPLGGSKGGKVKVLRNTFIIFLVSGFWHGANWTFLVWGGLNALYFLPLLLTQRNRRNLGIVAENSALPTLREALSVLFTFVITVLAWTFFRADSVQQAWQMELSMFQSFSDLGDLKKALQFAFGQQEVYVTALFILVMLIAEWRNRREQHGLQIARRPAVWRWAVYLVLIFTVLIFGEHGQMEFIYFQF